MFSDSLGKLISTLVFGAVGDISSQKASNHYNYPNYPKGQKFVQGYDYPTAEARGGIVMSLELEELLQGCTTIVSYGSTLTRTRHEQCDCGAGSGQTMDLLRANVLCLGDTAENTSINTTHKF